jgi:hypothetical protein
VRAVLSPPAPPPVRRVRVPGPGGGGGVLYDPYAYLQQLDDAVVQGMCVKGQYGYM